MNHQTGFVTEGEKRNFLNVKFFTYEYFLAFLLVASVFLTPFYFRDNISSFYAYFNVPFYAAIVLIALHFSCRFDIPMVILWCLLSGLFLFAEVQAGTNTPDIVQFFILYCLPLLVMQLSITTDVRRRKHFATVCIQTVNVITGIVFVILLADLVSGSAVMNLIATHLMPGVSSWVSGNIMSRHASIWGHYLLTAGYYLVFYYLNVIYHRFYGLWLIDVRLLYIVASIGILSTGGKTAIVIYLVSVIWFTMTGRHRVRNATVLTLFFLVLYFFGAFDVVLDRFGADDLSSGRNDAVAALFAVEYPRFLTGYGESFIAHMSAYAPPYTVAVASEYSFLGLAYKFGILFVLLMIILFLRHVFAISKRTKSWMPLFMTTMLIVYFTTFNAFAVIPDAYILVALFIVIVTLISGEGNNRNEQTCVDCYSDIQTLRNA